MSVSVAWFVVGFAAGQGVLVLAGLYLHHRRERLERQWRGRFQTPVVTQWPQDWTHSQETRQ